MDYERAIVNEATATALNDRLAERGAFESADPLLLRLVTGRVSDQTGKPLTGSRVRAFHAQERGKPCLGVGDPMIRYTPLPAMPLSWAPVRRRLPR